MLIAVSVNCLRWKHEINSLTNPFAVVLESERDINQANGEQEEEICFSCSIFSWKSIKTSNAIFLLLLRSGIRAEPQPIEMEINRRTTELRQFQLNTLSGKSCIYMAQRSLVKWGSVKRMPSEIIDVTRTHLRRGMLVYD